METWLNVVTKAVNSISSLIFESPGNTDGSYPKIDSLNINHLPHDTRVIGVATKLENLFKLKKLTPRNIFLDINKGDEAILNQDVSFSRNIMNLTEVNNWASILSLINSAPQQGKSPFDVLKVGLLSAVVLHQGTIAQEILNHLDNQPLSVRISLISQMKVKNGFNLLHLCVLSSKNPAFLKTLLRRAEMKPLLNDAKNIWQMSPLMLSALLEYSWAYGPLIEAGSDINLLDKCGNSALLLSLLPHPDEIHLASADLFLSHISSFTTTQENFNLNKFLEMRNNVDLSALDMASANADIHTINLLISNGVQARGVSSSIKNQEIWTPFLFACLTGNVELVTQLLASGALVDERSSKSFVTGLHIAAFYGFCDLADLLLSRGADGAALTLENGSPLLYSCINGKTECARILLERLASDVQANASAKLKFCLFSAATIAMKKNQTNCARMIILRIHQAGLDCSPLLLQAVKHRCQDNQILDMLLAIVPNSREIMMNGKNILVVAAETKNLTLFSSLSKNANLSTELKEHPSIRKFVAEINQQQTPVDENISNIVTTCVVCMEKDAATKFLPCGHVQCCKLCAQMTLRADPRCPMCRNTITNIQNL